MWIQELRRASTTQSTAGLAPSGANHLFLLHFLHAAWCGCHPPSTRGGSAPSTGPKDALQPGETGAHLGKLPQSVRKELGVQLSPLLSPPT